MRHLSDQIKVARVIPKEEVTVDEIGFWQCCLIKKKVEGKHVEIYNFRPLGCQC